MVASMREAGLSANSINSYTKLLKSILSWCIFYDIDTNEDITKKIEDYINKNDKK